MASSDTIYECFCFVKFMIFDTILSLLTKSLLYFKDSSNKLYRLHLYIFPTDNEYLSLFLNYLPDTFDDDLNIACPMER